MKSTRITVPLDMICARGTNLLGLYLPGMPSVSIRPEFRHAQILLMAELISVHLYS
jgi:hypothetical protein